jgi:outer membrane protein assembly factor BamD
MTRKFWFVVAVLFLTGCGGYPEDIDIGGDLDEPDRTLFNRSLFDLDNNRYVRARLELNTLINTYPDSEFLPQAKYAVAESFYRMGTRGDLIQAEAEFKDYITFFPTSDLADDAQLMVGMSHVRQMEKSDRDPTQAQMAELEFKNFVSSYPDSPLLDEAKEKLRAVQEVLADGVLQIANYYSTVESYPAATDRYLEILEKYPDSVQMPEALYRLAETMRLNDDEGESILYYTRVIRDHPLSEFVEDATARLAELDQSIPTANPVALARAETAPEPDEKSLLARVFGIWSRRPDISTETTAASIIPGEEGGANGAEGVFEVEGTVVGPDEPLEGQ